MKSQRISSKDYEELLKTMRRWPQPYLGIVAKLVGHLGWQFDEITRLKERLDKLEQPELLNEEQRLTQGFVGSVIKKQHDTKPSTAKPPKTYTTEPERIAYIHTTFGIDSKEWKTMLKLKRISHEQALKLIDA